MKQVFPIVPASSGPLMVLIPLAILLLGLVAMSAWFVYSSRHAQFEISSEGLRITGALYGRFIPASELLVGGARTLDLKPDCPYRLRRRTNGVGLPGYQAGWFKLNNGERALAFITDSSRVVCVPTTQGYSVLLSVADPQAFLNALRAIH